MVETGNREASPGMVKRLAEVFGVQVATVERWLR